MTMQLLFLEHSIRHEIGKRKIILSFSYLYFSRIIFILILFVYLIKCIIKCIIFMILQRLTFLH